MPKNGAFDSAIQTYGWGVIRWRWPIILVTVLLVAAAASGGRFLWFNTDYRVFFSEDNPQLQSFDELQNVYGKNDNVLFVLAPKGGEVFTAPVLAAVEHLTEQAWQIPLLRPCRLGHQLPAHPRRGGRPVRSRPGVRRRGAAARGLAGSPGHRPERAAAGQPPHIALRARHRRQRHPASCRKKYRRGAGRGRPRQAAGR